MKFRVEWHDELASSNSFLGERARREPALAEGLVVAARVQTAGRGRGQRSWLATPGDNLTFSVLLRPGTAPAQTASLPMAAALAVTDLLAALGLRASLKWPNDVLVAGDKICGVLLEALAGDLLVLGLGLNVNMSTDALSRIDQPATSLSALTGRVFALPALLDDWLAVFAPRYDVWRRGGFPALRTDWEQRAQPVGLMVSRGVIAGYGAHGQLLVRAPDGTLQDVWSAPEA